MKKTHRFTAAATALALFFLTFFTGCATVTTEPPPSVSAQAETAAPAEETAPPATPAPHIAPASRFTTHEVGTLEFSVSNAGGIAQTIFYPSLWDITINKLIQEYAMSLALEAQQEIAGLPAAESGGITLSVDYESFAGPENYASVCFYITCTHPDGVSGFSRIETLNLDLAENRALSAEDVFTAESTESVAGLAGVEAKAANLARFLIKKDGIGIICGEQPVMIPYGQLSGMLYIDYSGEGPDVTMPPEKRPIPSYKPQPLSEREIDPSAPMIALTFDDGPKSGTTNRILDTLEKYGAVATFFVLGIQVDTYSSLTVRAAQQGCEIGNHSRSHKDLTTLNADGLYDQVTSVQQQIADLLGFAPRLLRPPYGAHNQTVRSTVNMPVALWSIDTEDWRSRDANAVIDTVIGHVKDGDIILMHDIYSSTAEAVEYLVPALLADGYQLVTVSELLQYKLGGAQAAQAYHSGR